MKAKDGFGRDGYDADRTDLTESANAPDVIEISSGFFVDDAGNTSTYSKTDQTITYSDVAGLQLHHLAPLRLTQMAVQNC